MGDRLRVSGMVMAGQDYVQKREAQDSVFDKDLSAPPGSPSDLDRYIVGSTPTGDWSGHEDEIATYRTSVSGWFFVIPETGFRAWVDDEAQLYVFTTGSGWSQYSPSVGPAGDPGELQFNESGSLGGTDKYYFDATNQVILTNETSLATNDDLQPGGLSLRHVTNGTAFQIRNDDVAHPFTTAADEKTYATFTKVTSAYGGLDISGYGTAHASSRAVNIEGHLTSLETDDPSSGTDTSADACIHVTAWKSNGGTGRQSPATDENILAVYNGSQAKVLVKGSGNLWLTDNGQFLSYAGVSTNYTPNLGDGGFGVMLGGSAGSTDDNALDVQTRSSVHHMTALASEYTIGTMGRRGAEGALRAVGYGASDIGVEVIARVDDSSGTATYEAPITLFAQRWDGGTSTTVGDEWDESGAITTPVKLMTLNTSGSASSHTIRYAWTWENGFFCHGPLHSRAPNIGYSLVDNFQDSDCGLNIRQATYTDLAIVARMSNVSTRYFEDTTLAAFGKRSDDNDGNDNFFAVAPIRSDGGARVIGCAGGTTEAGLSLEGYSDDDVFAGDMVDVDTSSCGCIIMLARKWDGVSSSGSGLQDLDDDDNALVLRSGAPTGNTGALIVAKGNGTLNTKGSIITGFNSTAETGNGAIDVGGVAIDNGDGTGKAFIMKNDAANHGMTTLTTNYVYTQMEPLSKSYGGLLIETFAGTSGTIGFYVNAVCGAPPSTTSGSADAAIVFCAGKKSGTTKTTLGNDENVLSMKNGTSTLWILKGDGDTYQDGTSNPSQPWDDEEDIMLCEAARFKLAGWDNKVREQYGSRLEELGIVEDGMWSDRKMKALLLGAVGQMWNMIRKLGERCGMSEEEIADAAFLY